MTDPMLAAAPVQAGPRPLSRKEKLGFGLGDLASNLSWNFTGSFLLYFYTNVAAISAAVAGTLMLLARVLDAVADPVVGAAVDRTRSRHGRARPYLLYGAVPFGVLSVLAFVSPDLSHTGKVIYAAVTFLLMGVVYSVVNIPYGSLMPLMTRDSHERMQLGTARAVGMSIGTIFVAVATPHLVTAFGGGSEERGYLLTAILLGTGSAVFFLLTFRATTEHYGDLSATEAAGKTFTGAWTTVRQGLHNGPWILAALFMVVNFTRLGLLTTVTVYFSLYVLKEPWTISILLPLISGSLLVGSLAAPRYFARFGKRRGNVLALAVGALLYLVMPFTESVLPLLITVYTCACLVISLSLTSSFTLVADSVDYHEWKFGNRATGLLNAAQSLATKLGTALGSALVAGALAWTAFDPDHVAAATVTGLRWLYYGAPIALLLLQLLVMCFWRMDALHPRILEELKERQK
ncbi:MFS transporter [Streptomyces sp. NBC_01220]|uniref:MFS transporter n=1 Tax=Streptomyces sp. NBC_01220 TaxID=2903781 RepID=UPI00352FD9F6|nr:MFS transporter [Streptomyces sp. NBC_01220]